MNLHQKCVAGIVIATVVAGCAFAPPPQPPMTPEQQAMALEMQKAFLARLQGAAPPSAAPAEKTAVTQTLSAQNRADVLRSLAVFETTGAPVSVERHKDGMLIAGKPYADAEGVIINSAANLQSGDVGYFVRMPDGAVKVKYMRAGLSTPAMTLAVARRENGVWSVQTVTGETSSGDRLIPASDGVIVARASSAFHYTPASGFVTLAAPPGFHIAEFQNGDIASTGYMLIEKDASTGQNQLQELMGLATSLKQTVGLEKKDDYALMNIKTGQTVTFDKGLDDNKTAAGGTGCEMQSQSLRLAKCETVDMQASLYETSGMRNDEHYFWSLFWYTTPQGAFAVAKEAGTRKVTLTELATGKKVVLFERTLGIANFESAQSPAGVISVEAQVGFSREKVADAVAFFKQSPMVSSR